MHIVMWNQFPTKKNKTADWFNLVAFVKNSDLVVVNLLIFFFVYIVFAECQKIHDGFAI